MRMRQCTRIQRNVLIHLLEAYHLPLRQFGDGSGVKCYFFHNQMPTGVIGQLRC